MVNFHQCENSVIMLQCLLNFCHKNYSDFSVSVCVSGSWYSYPSLHTLLFYVIVLEIFPIFLILKIFTHKCMQVLGKIYAILSDANKRAIYDEDGTVDEEDDATFKQV